MSSKVDLPLARAIGLHLRTITLIAAIGCVAVPALKAQQFGFTQFAPRDGLAQSQVRCMAEDRWGYLWFGTLGGASRFDGLDFTNYGSRQGLPDAQVDAMLLTKSGSFWLACGAFLVEFDGQRMRPMALPDQASTGRILALAEGSDGSLFIGTDGNGVLCVKDGKALPLEGFPRDTVSSVRTLLASADGSLLIGIRNGLLRWKDGRCARIELPMAASVSSLAMDKEGTLWVGTFGNGLFGLAKNGAVQIFDEQNGLLQNNVRTLLVDRRGRLWAGTKFGVNVLQQNGMRVYTIHQGMPNDNIWCIAEDRTGGLWFGTDGAGALRYAGERFVTYTVIDGLCSDLVMTAVSDKAGDMWLGTYGNGICRMDGMAMVTTKDGLPNNTIWCSILGADSTLWFGTSDGLCRVVNGMVTALDSGRGLVGQRVLSLFLRDNGALWCGTRDGLWVRHVDGRMEDLATRYGMELRGVRSIRELHGGAIWLATDNGAVRLLNGQAERFTTVDGLSNNTVFCLEGDAKGRIWMGTSSGLTCYDRGRITAMDLGKDFGSNYVDLLLKDQEGDLWAGTNNGLFHFIPDSLLADPSNVEHFTEVDGLRGSECNLNAGFIDRQDRLFFGTNAGLLMHDPGRPVLRNSEEPIISYITGIRSFMQPLGLPTAGSLDTNTSVSLNIAYKKNHLTFDYTAIDLVNGDHVRFQYRLEGFDNAWLPPTGSRLASYSNLPHGDYVFMVRAADRRGNWGPSDTFAFTIAPPFWLRWWFFALCAILIGLLVYGVAQWRKMRRARLEKTRQLILRSRMLQLEQQALNANMNRHFIFNALTSIQYCINRQDRAMANKYLTSFAKLIRRNLDASQNDTTSLADELSRLDLYLLLERMRFKDKFSYRITIAPDVEIDRVEIPAMMLQPYVENSIWHGILPMARPGKVDIIVERVDEERTRIRITDDGIGIDRSKDLKTDVKADHISRGIEITKGRAEVLRKLDLTDIRIQGPDQISGAMGPIGTQVVIELPSNPQQHQNRSKELHSKPGEITFGIP